MKAYSLNPLLKIAHDDQILIAGAPLNTFEFEGSAKVGH